MDFSLGRHIEYRIDFLVMIGNHFYLFIITLYIFNVN